MLPYFSAYVTSKTALIRFSECLAFEVKDHGIAVFAMGPGTVRTAMSEYSLNSPEGRTWLPWFRDIFDEGRDLPPERPAALMVALASGKADVLSGRYVYPADDLDRLSSELKLDRIAVLGHSGQGFIALRYAAHLPAMVITVGTGNASVVPATRSCRSRHTSSPA